MSQVAVVAGDGDERNHLIEGSLGATPFGVLGAAASAIAESRRVSALAADELAAWARILHEAA